MGTNNRTNPMGGCPQIPDEWNRENTKTSTKQVAQRHQQRTNPISNAMQTGEPNTTTSDRKRKRNIAVNATGATGGTGGAMATHHDAKATHHDDMATHTTSDDVSGNDAVDNDTMGTDEVFSSVPEHLNDEHMPLLSSSQTPGPSSSQNIPPPTIPGGNRRHSVETESVMRGLYHQVEKLARRPGCALDEGIYLDSIMTHIPYVEVLQQMFGGNAVTDSACVPIVTRAYEESYMREVFSGVDEACVMGGNCECQFIDEHNPFTGVQFTLPVEAFSSAATEAGMINELSSNKLCVLCCRKHTQSLFYEALYNHRAYSACIQLYGNICDRPGEYAKEAMLICPLSGPINNMPLPVVAHQRNRYSVVVHNGVRQLRQHRVAYEDFHVPSSSRS